MLKNYLKIALKGMLQQKFFTAVSLFGTSITIMIFSITAGLVQLSFGDGDRLANKDRLIYFEATIVSETFMDSQSPTITAFWKTVKKAAANARVTRYEINWISSFRNGKLNYFPTAFTDENIWKAYAFKFIEGRPFTAKEVANGQPYAVISKAAARYFFGDTSPIGKYVGNHQSFKVIGVVEDGLSLRAYPIESAVIWVPVTRIFAPNVSESALSKYCRATILVQKPADALRITQALRKLQGEKTGTGTSAEIGDLSAKTFYESLPVGYLLLYAGGFLFFMTVIPALNLVGLNINRIAERSTEIGVRKAFGASSSVLAGQFLVENSILTFFGGLLGILLILVFSGPVIRLVYHDTPNPELAANMLLNWSTIGYSFAGMLFFGFLSGILPAWRMSRLPAVHALKGGDR